MIQSSPLYLFIDKPRVSLRLGKSLDPDNLRTGNDVYFECDVKSNPMPHKLVWLHRVREDLRKNLELQIGYTDIDFFYIDFI